MLALSPCLWWNPSSPPPRGAGAKLVCCVEGPQWQQADHHSTAGRPFLTSKQAAAPKNLAPAAGTAMEHTSWCGLERRKKFLMGVPSTKSRVRIRSSYFCSRTLDDRFVCVPILRVRSCTVGCASRGGCAAVLSCRSGAAVVDGRRAASCRCARCFDRFLLTRAPVPKIFGACGGHRARSLALQNTGQIQARPGQRSLR